MTSPFRARTSLLAAAMILFVACDEAGRSVTSRPGTARPAAGTLDRGSAIVATYGEHTLTQADVTAAMERLPAASRVALADPERREQFVDSLIMNDLLFDEGTRLRYDSDPEVERQVRELQRRLVVQRVMRDYRQRPAVSDDEARAYHRENPDLFAGVQIRASHILLEDRAAAESLHAELVENPERFAALAREHSIDKASAKRGGDLGRFGTGRMVPGFERVAFALREGEISEVVSTRFGHHVIKVTKRHEGEPKAFDAVAAQIKSTLATERIAEQVKARLAALREAAHAEIDTGTLAAIEIPDPPPSQPSMGIRGH